MSDATIMALPPTIHVQTDSPSVSVHLSPSIHSSSCPITMLCSSELRPSEVRYRSQFYVYMNDSLIASEKTTLELLSTSTSSQNPKESEMEETSAGMVNVWGTRFIPEYWEDFKKSFPDDLSQCKVVQAVYDNDTILCHRMVYLFELTHNETHSNTSSVGRPHLDAPARVMSLPPPAIPPEPDDIDLQYPNEEQLDAYSGSSSPSQSAEYAFSPITTTVNPTTASSMSASVCNCPGCATSMQNNVIVQAPGVPSTSPNVSQNPFSYTYFWGNNPIPQLDVSRISQNESIPTTMSIRSNSYSHNTRSRDVMLALSTDMNVVDGSDPYSYFERNGRTETSSWDFSLKDEDQKLFKSSPTEMEIDQPWLHEPMPFSLPQLPPVASLLANARTTDINDAPMQEYIAGSPSRHGDGFGQLC
ncbi:hypothetical protein K435DRAFT_782203 [Dendrothele bispora CBS 962.96]|uniref:Uncharacterized protein n=1 Tax=Dendrothele bispora (strain CBS 962.96) TaxID=1314807 RepID=A0A4S8LG73_DENBC|nr:hypothetical protein K435DRAFT_782203 [Dendrothele bispora CBS 962.96]